MAKFRFQDLKIWQLAIQISVTLCAMPYALWGFLMTYGSEKEESFSTKSKIPRIKRKNNSYFPTEENWGKSENILNNSRLCIK